MSVLPQGLPAGAREYNESLAQLHVVPRQTAEEVVAILDQASKAQGMAWWGGWSVCKLR